MSELSLAELCELGQQQLVETRYLDAQATLARAGRAALAACDWDMLWRLYLPLQEARRQRRQRCGEGTVCLDYLANGPADRIDAQQIIQHFPQGQLLVAGWGTIEPARQVRAIAVERGLYVETFLAAVCPMNGRRVVVVVPTENARLPDPAGQAMDQLTAQLPDNCLVLSEDQLPHGPREGTYETYGQVMALWERLHAPFLAAADAQTDLISKIAGYRQTIEVDYACELAHQRLSEAARELGRIDPCDRRPQAAGPFER